MLEWPCFLHHLHSFQNSCTIQRNSRFRLTNILVPEQRYGIRIVFLHSVQPVVLPMEISLGCRQVAPVMLWNDGSGITAFTVAWSKANERIRCGRQF